MNEFDHHGVLGMKWGVRKDGMPQGFQYGKRGAKKTAAAAKRAIEDRKVTSEDAREHRELKSKAVRSGVKSLSNQELQKVNKREKLLNTYANNNSRRRRGAVETAKNVVLYGAMAISVAQAASKLSQATTGKDYVFGIINEIPVAQTIFNPLIPKKS